MRLDYHLTKNDRAVFAKAMIRLRNHLGLNILKVLTFAILAVLFYRSFIHRGLPHHIAHLPSYQAHALIYALLFISCIAIVSLWVINRIKKNYKRLLKQHPKQVTLHYDEQGLSYQSDSGHKQYQWQELHAVIKDNSGIYLYDAEQSLFESQLSNVLIIPRNAFATDETYQLQTCYIQTKVPHILHVA